MLTQCKSWKTTHEIEQSGNGTIMHCSNLGWYIFPATRGSRFPLFRVSFTLGLLRFTQLLDEEGEPRLKQSWNNIWNRVYFRRVCTASLFYDVDEIKETEISVLLYSWGFQDWGATAADHFQLKSKDSCSHSENTSNTFIDPKYLERLLCLT